MNGSTGVAGPTGKIGNKIPKGYKSGQMQQFTPEQMKLFSEMFGLVSPESYLSKLSGGDESTFQEMEAPALRQFSELQGNIASRFSGMGGLGARKSSGFQNTMNSAASNFAQDLAGRRQELQRQALSDMMGISNSLLGQRPYEQFLYEKQKKPGFWDKFGGIAGGTLGAIGGGIAGGPAGALGGAQMGYSLGNSLSGKGSQGGGFGTMDFSGLGVPSQWGSMSKGGGTYPGMGSAWQ